jgi:hypothetical protein
MYSMAYPLAVLATCVASANAFMATGPVLRASPAPAISRAKLGSLKMEAATEVCSCRGSAAMLRCLCERPFARVCIRVRAPMRTRPPAPAPAPACRRDSRRVASAVQRACACASCMRGVARPSSSSRGARLLSACAELVLSDARALSVRGVCAARVFFLSRALDLLACPLQKVVPVEKHLVSVHTHPALRMCEGTMRARTLEKRLRGRDYQLLDLRTRSCHAVAHANSSRMVHVVRIVDRTITVRVMAQV